MKVKHKLAILVFCPAILALSLILGVSQSMDKLSRSTQSVIDERLSPMLILNQLNSVYSRSIIDLAHKTRAQMLFWNESEAALLEAKARLDTLWAQYRAGSLSDKERQVLQEAEPAFAAAEKTIASIEQFINEKSSYSMGSFIDLSLYGGIEPIIQVIAQLTEIQETLASETAMHASELRTDRKVFLYLLGAVLVALSTLFGLWIMRGLQRDISCLLTTITDIERDRNLTLRSGIASENEFGDMSRRFDRMIEVFGQLLRDTRESGDVLLGQSQQLIHSASENQHQSSRQHDALKQTHEAMQTLTQSAQVVLENVESTNQLAGEVQRITADGEQAVNKTIDAISDVASLVNQTSDSMTQLRQQSEKIGSVITVINTIAEQTNLLALNAAIEAARAGEQGRGFAVVAGEVRELASRTAESTAEIQDIVQNIQSSTQASWTLMQRGEEATQLAVNQAGTSGQQLTELRQQFELMLSKSQQIHDAADSQTDTVSAMEASLADLAGLADEGTTLSLESFDLAKAMDDTVGQVSKGIRQFVLES